MKMVIRWNKLNFIRDIFRRGRGEKEPLKPKNLELVYLQQSPNYCEKNILLGSSGKKFKNRYKYFWKERRAWNVVNSHS